MLILVNYVFVEIPHLCGSLLIASVSMRPTPGLDRLTLLGLPEFQQLLNEPSPPQLDVVSTEVDLEIHYRHTGRILHQLFKSKVKLAILFFQSQVRVFQVPQLFLIYLN
jgi:hypothetical protein